MTMPVESFTTTGDTSPIPRLALKLREAAAAIGVSERTVWEWVRSGDLPSLRRGRVVLIPIRELRDWLTRESAGDASDG